MSANSFRSSLNGFNRKDVISYIFVLSKRLEKAVSDYNELKAKYEKQAGEENIDVVDCSSVNSSLAEKISSLESEIASLKAENEELKEKLRVQEESQGEATLPNHLL